MKASSGPRYVVGCRSKVDKAKLTAGTRVALDMTTLTIMRYLPREVHASSSAPHTRPFALLLSIHVYIIASSADCGSSPKACLHDAGA